MKYWILTTEYPPQYGGGIGTYCYHTAVMLAQKGHQVSVFINDMSVSEYKVQSGNGIRVIRFNPSQTNSHSFLGHQTNLSYEFAHIVKQFIEQEGKPDVIEAQEYLGIAYYLLQYKYLLYDWCVDVPVLITMHSPSILSFIYNKVSEYRYPNYWICQMEFFCLRAATHIISPSKYIIGELDNRVALQQQQITIIRNPYLYTQTVEHIDNNEKQNQIIFYGKLTAQKGVFELLNYFKKLWDTGFSRSLYLIGGQDIVYHPEGIAMGTIIKNKYTQYISEGLLIFEDRIKPNAIANRLASAEVIIVPSNNDNFPYVVLEMMALGKIVLVSKQGGQAEIVEHGINGFLFDHRLPDTFAEQLQNILSLTNSQREIISKNAIERVKIISGYEEVYAKKNTVLKELLSKQKFRPTDFPFTNNQSITKDYSPQNLEHTNKKLSVVIPYYNLGKYIDDTVNAIKKTLYGDVEIIIVNDGSNEQQSIKQLDNYRKDNIIRVIDTENRGLAAARNIGAMQARGHYLAFLDADDTVSSTYYPIAIAVLAHYKNVDFVGCWCHYFENGSGVWPTFSPELPLLLFHNIINSSALVYKRESFLNGGGNDEKMPFQGVEDYDSVVSMVGKGYNGVVIPELLFQYRVRKSSMFRQISPSKKIILSQYMVNKHSALYAHFATEIVNLSTANGPGIWVDNPSLDLHLADKMPFGSKISLKFIRLIKRNKLVRAAAYKIYSYIKK